MNAGPMKGSRATRPRERPEIALWAAAWSAGCGCVSSATSRPRSSSLLALPIEGLHVDRPGEAERDRDQRIPPPEDDRALPGARFLEHAAHPGQQPEGLDRAQALR